MNEVCQTTTALVKLSDHYVFVVTTGVELKEYPVTKSLDPMSPQEVGEPLDWKVVEAGTLSPSLVLDSSNTTSDGQ